MQVHVMHGLAAFRACSWGRLSLNLTPILARVPEVRESKT